MGGAASRISGLAKWLVNYEHEVSVITGYPNYPTGKIYPEYKNTNKIVENINGVRIFRVKVFPASHNFLIIRFINYLTLLISSLWIGMRKRYEFDVLIASSPPLTIGIVGRILSKFYKIPWIFDVRDIWPDVAVEAGMLKENGLLNKISTKIAKYLYNTADHITPVTKNKYLKISGYGVKPDKISIVENGIDSDLIKDAIEKDWRTEYRLQNKFVLTYAGLIGRAQGVKIIVDAAELLKGKSDIHFIIVGEGIDKRVLKDQVKNSELENITFIDNQPKELIPSLLKTSDAAIIPLISNNLKDAIPSKLLEAWSCKLPVILIAGGEAAEIVTNINGGIVINSNESIFLKETIIKFKNNPSKLLEYGENGFKFTMNNLDRKYLAKKMEKVINSIMEKNG
jgi:glycosyltransferase involved in cell wall biosynthesis